jgi:hypothetical protein
MDDKSKPECCNGHCNQGRECPYRVRLEHAPLFTQIVWFVVTAMILLLIVKTVMS